MRSSSKPSRSWSTSAVCSPTPGGGSFAEYDGVIGKETLSVGGIIDLDQVVVCLDGRVVGEVADALDAVEDEIGLLSEAVLPAGAGARGELALKDPDEFRVMCANALEGLETRIVAHGGIHIQRATEGEPIAFRVDAADEDPFAVGTAVEVVEGVGGIVAVEACPLG